MKNETVEIINFEEEYDEIVRRVDQLSRQLVALIREKGNRQQKMSLGYPEIFFYNATLSDGREILTWHDVHSQIKGLDPLPEILKVWILNQRNDQLGYTAKYHFSTKGASRSPQGLVEISVSWLKGIGHLLSLPKQKASEYKKGDPELITGLYTLRTYESLLNLVLQNA